MRFESCNCFTDVSLCVEEGTKKRYDEICVAAKLRGASHLELGQGVLKRALTSYPPLTAGQSLPRTLVWVKCSRLLIVL